MGKLPMIEGWDNGVFVSFRGRCRILAGLLCIYCLVYLSRNVEPVITPGEKVVIGYSQFCPSSYIRQVPIPSVPSDNGTGKESCRVVQTAIRVIERKEAEENVLTGVVWITWMSKVDLVLKLAGNTGSGRGRDCCSVRSRGAVAMSPKSPMWMPAYEECIESNNGVKEVVSDFRKIGSIFGVNNI